MTRTSVECVWSFVAVLVGSWLAFGCGSRYAPITGEQDEVLSVTHCITDSECSPTQVCAGGVCQSACASDADCVAGQQCRSGVCRDVGGTPACTNTSECPVSMLCNLATQQCVQCLSDDHCDEGQFCRRNNTCGTDPSLCASDVDCPGLHCDVTSRQCVQCLNSSHCPPGRICRDHGCFGDGPPLCTSDVDCVAYGKVCELNSGRCRDCANDTECGTGRICSAGTCTSAGGGGGGGGGGRVGDPCTSYTECNGLACFLGVCSACFADFMCLDLLATLSGNTRICDIATGTCVPPDCASAYDCPTGEGCYSGHCGSCVDDSECRAGEVCSGGTCAAAVVVPECVANSDCWGGNVCVSGACVGCTGSHQCDAGLECVAHRCQSSGTVAGAGEAGFGEPCTGAADDCGGSFVCLGDGASGVCSRTCIGSGKGDGADCPLGYACARFDSGALDGLSLCSAADMLPADYPGHPFNLAPGASCAAGNGCQTSVCNDDQTCARSCLADRDCRADEVCWAVRDTDGTAVGLHLCVASDLVTYKAKGAACASGAECDSGLCAGRCTNGGGLCNESDDCPSGGCRGTCANHCRSNADCAPAPTTTTPPAEQGCSPWPTRIDADGMGGWATACLPKYFDGTAADGAACAAHEDCRSDWCIDSTCTTPCGITADCTGPLDDHHCLPISFVDDSGEVITSQAFCLL